MSARYVVVDVDTDEVEQFVGVGDGYRLWAQSSGSADASPLLLVMGANASGVVWPDELVDALAERHMVIVYDHRDTGRSTWAFSEHPYALSDLAGDALRVLDAFGAERAHMVGMSMGGVLVQLLLADHPERLSSAIVFCTAALGSGDAAIDGVPEVELPGPDPRLLAIWEEMGQPRDPDAELTWRVEHWRLLNGDELAFQPEVWHRLEQRVIDHAGRFDSPVAHALADQSDLERDRKLSDSTVPTLVVEAPADPINPPPHSAQLAATIGNSQLVTIPGMGHALHPAILSPLITAILNHTSTVDTVQ